MGHVSEAFAKSFWRKHSFYFSLFKCPKRVQVLEPTKGEGVDHRIKIHIEKYNSKWKVISNLLLCRICHAYPLYSFVADQWERPLGPVRRLSIDPLTQAIDHSLVSLNAAPHRRQPGRLLQRLICKRRNLGTQPRATPEHKLHLAMSLRWMYLYVWN